MRGRGPTKYTLVEEGKGQIMGTLVKILTNIDCPCL